MAGFVVGGSGLAVGDNDPKIPKESILAWFELHTNILKSRTSYEKFRDLYVHVHRPVIPHRVVDHEGRNTEWGVFSDDEQPGGGADDGGAAAAAAAAAPADAPAPATAAKATSSNPYNYSDSDSDSDSDSEEDSKPTIEQRYKSAVTELMKITTIEEFVYFISGFYYHLIWNTPEQGKKECFEDWEKEKEIRIDKYWYWFYETILNNYDRKQHDNQRAVNDQIKSMDKTYLVKLRF